MALPYYYPPSVPLGPGVASMSSERVTQIYQQHNLQTMAYLQNVQYFPPIRYNFTPIPFKPYYTAPINSLLKPPTCYPDNLPFPQTVPNMAYPVAPVPFRPVHYTPTAPSFQSQLRQVVKRVAESDARMKAESKRLKASESEFRPVSSNGSLDNKRPSDLIVISDDEIPTPILESQKPLYVGNNPTVIPDPAYEQQLLQQPGLGQQYITKIRKLVEGFPETVEIKKSPSNKSSTKEKKVRQKCTKTKETISKKKTTPEPSEPSNESNSMPITWQIDYNSQDKDHVVLGSNGTLISRTFYETIPWNSFKLSTRILVQYYFTPFALATQKINGDNQLDKNIIDDIVNHIMVKCGVGRVSVRHKIEWICADEALKRKQKVEELC
ncbi:uncharacterized protein LOC129911713 [Episyrphus balteatus]|uniref:uncharacterized protein LOC129911713 n=1 Tax=Episyrphus balteatus TaxID=286459 RepID=UPI0024851B24|nr:uncharacterized protein LOC129911713 [Episyrphus balteatus]